MGTYFDADFGEVKLNKDGSVDLVGWAEQARHSGAPKKDKESEPQTPEERAQELERRKRHKAAELEDYLVANDWEYTIVLSECQKYDAASQWDYFRNQLRKYKIKFVWMPIDHTDGFLIVATIIGAPAYAMQAIKYCRCEVIPFKDAHIKAMKNALQIRNGLRSYTPSTKLPKREGKKYTNKNKQKWMAGTHWDSVTGFNAVKHFDSVADFEYWEETGRHMSDEAKKYDNAYDVYGDKIAMKYLETEFKKMIKNASEQDRINYVGLKDVDIEALDKSRYVVDKCRIRFFAKDADVVVYQAQYNAKDKEIKEIKPDSFPVVYFWKNTKTGDLVYGGESMTPYSRQTDHIGRNKYSKKNTSRVLEYINDTKTELNDLIALYLPVGYYCEDSKIVLAAKTSDELKLLEARLQKLLVHNWKSGNVLTEYFLSVSYDDVLEAERQFDEKCKTDISKGCSVNDIADKIAKEFTPALSYKKTTNLKNYLERNYEYDEKYSDDIIAKCVEWWGKWFEGMRLFSRNGFVTLDVIMDIRNTEGLYYLFNDMPKEEKEKREQKKQEINKRQNEKAGVFELDIFD